MAIGSTGFQPAAWQSKFVKESNGTLIYTPDSKGDHLPDFSKVDDHTSETFKRRERPSVYVNEKNEVVALFTTCLPENGPARIVIQPVDKYYPKN